MTDIAYEIEAFNTATESENRIHDDGVAKRFGFTGGLVPGVDIHAYLTRAAIIRFGPAFLSGGVMHSRFTLPVYDGATVSVTASGDNELNIELRSGGPVLANATASLADTGAAPDIAAYPTSPVPAPEDRPAAGPDSLIEGQALGSWSEVADAEGQTDYRAAVRETHNLYPSEQLVHPGFLLRRANSALKDNVLLGPWIHVGSTIRHFAPLEIGATLETRSKVARLYEHKGHGFVDLDVALFSEGRGIAQVDHTAIYEPRQVRQSA